MPDDSSPTSPETPPPYDPRRRVGTGLAGETTRNEGSTIRHDALQRPLEIIGDFEVMSKLGQGGMGAVYRARQISLDRQVALKVLPAKFEADADYVSRFQREARVAASLSHANLVKVYAAGVADGCHYIAMELIEGETLSQSIKRNALPPLEALRIILDVARALDCGWRSARLIHRDIKPGNIFLSVDGEVKLGDLGLAKIVGGDSTGLTHTGTAMGTPHYISPEQARGDRDLDFRADIYSLGCTLYQMLTKQTPYSGHEPMVVMNQHINATPPAILKVMPQCPLPLGRLVSKMLRKQRRERPASYEELIAALESVRAQLDPALTAPTVPAPSPPEPAEVGTPRRGILGEATAADAEGRRGAPSLPAKSKLPLYGGAGVLVVTAAAFFLWPKEEKLTKAQIYAREHAGEQQAGKESAPPASDGGRRSVAAPTSGSVGDDKASPSSATKAAPFVNTLGMKFVPVPIIGGPTGGQRVLFSVWDTRVQDYEVFATEAKRTWLKPDMEQGPTHPAVMVSWEDAQAFCTWLTQRERKAGKLGASEVYRLPSDHEWSCAVGLGEQEDAAKQPAEKSGKIADAFPWGTQWPPPAGAGNYAGEELKPALAAGKYTYVKDVIAGYNDGFVNTSPVGSFAVNRFGLFDIGGNVQQWCEDWFDKDQKERVLRGGSWINDNRATLSSSYRLHHEPGFRHSPYGFRCVLASATTAPPATLSTASYPQPRVWIDDTESLRSGLKDGSLVADGEWLVAAKTIWATLGGGRSFRDSAVRVVYSNGIGVRLRKPGKERPGRDYWASVRPRPTISLYDSATNKGTPLNGKVEVGTAYVLEATHELVFAAQGDQLSLWLDGKEVASVRDSTQSEGTMELVMFKDAMPAPRIKKVEYGELEAMGTGQAPAAPTGASTTPAAPKPAKLPDPAKWVPVFTTPESLTGSKGAEWTKDGIHLDGALYLSKTAITDVAVRAKVRLGSQTSFSTRITGENNRTALIIRPDASSMLLQKKRGKDYINLPDFRFKPSAATPQEIEVELVAVGKVFMVSVDGKVIGSIADDEEPVAGRVSVISLGGYVRDIAWQSLDGAPTPPTSARLSPSTEPWQDVLHDPAQINLYGAVERTPEGLRFTDYGYATRGRGQGPKRDGAVRMLATFGGVHPQLLVRQSEASGQYSLYARSDQVIVLGRYEIIGKQWTILREFALREPLRPGQDYEIELRAVGQTLIAKFNGVVLGTVADGIFPEGNFGMGVTNRVTDKNVAPALVKALEVLDLDAPGKTIGQ